MSSKINEKLMKKVVNLCNSRGFIFPGSEIYGGLANSWDYGPLGVELKKNIKDEWWKSFVSNNKYNVGVDAAILMNPKVWDASGHTSGFNDPMVDCKSCKARYRADKLIEEHNAKKDSSDSSEGFNPESWGNDKMSTYIMENKITCNKCGLRNFTEVRSFNLMFKTYMGVNEESLDEVYLRPETAQGIFTNFKNIVRATRKKLPFGIAQIGKSFRNEITPGNFIFRTREFEQMELEFFSKPIEAEKWFNYWLDYSLDWLKRLGMSPSSLDVREHAEDELSHYSLRTVDIEFKFPFGKSELWGIANRGDYDLKQHSKHSGVNLEYTDQKSSEKFLPYCIEPSLGLDRVLLAFLVDAYTIERVNDDERTVLKLDPRLAPYKAAILPLVKKRHSDKARSIYEEVNKLFPVNYDDSASIGKRYRRQDEIGTPLCITIDDKSLEKGEVTVRDRDTMKQNSVKVEDIEKTIINNLK